MTPEDASIDQIVARARDLYPSERERFLDRVCHGKQALRREVESRLAAEDSLLDLDVPETNKAPRGEEEPSSWEFSEEVPEVDGYRVLQPCVLYWKIGQGGMGSVYLAKHLQLDITVAVKCLDARLAEKNDEFVQRFKREARTAALVNHPNLIRVYGVDCRHGVNYLIMEYIKGETARERVLRKGALDVDEALTIVYEAAKGLAAAHKTGIVHRDVKPDNILISQTGEVKVADLGLARLTESRIERTGVFQLMTGSARRPTIQIDEPQNDGPDAEVTEAHDPPPPKGPPDQTKELYRRAIRKLRSDKPTRVELKEVVQELTRVLELDPDHPEARRKRAAASRRVGDNLRRSRRTGEALDWYTKALEDDNSRVHLVLVEDTEKVAQRKLSKSLRVLKPEPEQYVKELPVYLEGRVDYDGALEWSVRGTKATFGCEDGHFNALIPELGEGRQTIVVEAKGKGNRIVASDSVVVVVDLSAPLVTVTSVSKDARTMSPI